MSTPASYSLNRSCQQAAFGVDYSSRHGAPCPWCGKKTRVYRTNPWQGYIRIRYHRCTSGSCPLAAMKVSIKSVQIDV